MPRIELVPVPTAGGRQVVLQPVPVGRGERLRRLLDRMRGARGRRG